MKFVNPVLFAGVLLTFGLLSCQEEKDEEFKFTPPGEKTGVAWGNRYRMTLYQELSELSVGYTVFYLRVEDTVANTDELNLDLVMKPMDPDGLGSASAPHEQVQVSTDRKFYFCGMILESPTSSSVKRVLNVGYYKPGDPVKYQVNFPLEIKNSNRVTFQPDYISSLVGPTAYPVGGRTIETAVFFRRGVYPDYALKNVTPVFKLTNPDDKVVADTLAGSVLKAPGHYSGYFNFNKVGYWTVNVAFKSGGKVITTGEYYIEIK